MRQIRVLVGVLAAALACAHFPENQPLESWAPPTSMVRGRQAPGEAVVIVAFSGGGTRAAAFAYGVMEELAATHGPDGERRFLDEVDVLSGVSGGSFTAAYYGLHGDGLFEHFEERFLRRDIQSGLLWRLLSPINWVRMLSPRFSRSEVAARYYSGTIFDDATLGDLSGPEVVINATDLAIGVPFEFSQRQFDFLCSDSATFNLGRAVTASSAVPGIFAPIPLRNYAGSCGFEKPGWIADAIREGRRSPRRRSRARLQSSYLDATRRPLINLVDGGVSDNLAIRSLYDDVLMRGDPGASVAEIGYQGVEEIVVILVNAQRQPDLRFEEKGLLPSLWEMISAASSVQMNRFNFETIELVRNGFEGWTAELRGSGDRPHFHLVEVSFDALVDDEERAYMNALPTSLHLPDEDVDRLRSAGRRLLRESPIFQGALRALGWPESASGPAPAPRTSADLR